MFKKVTQVLLTPTAEAKLAHLISGGPIIADRWLKNRYSTLQEKGLVRITGNVGCYISGKGMTYVSWNIAATDAGKHWKPAD